jgi:hypothetical protein
MTLKDLFKKMLQKFSRPASAAPKPRRTRLTLEVLEGRVVLNSYVWTDASMVNDNWSTAGNWMNQADKSTNRVPSPFDNVEFDGGVTNNNAIVDANGFQIRQIWQIQVDASYTGTITLNDDLTVANLATIDGGTITGSGVLHIGDQTSLGEPQEYSAELDWNGGLLSAPSGSYVDINPISKAIIAGTADKTLDGRNLNDYGTVNWLGGGNIVLKNSAELLDINAMNVDVSNTATIKSNHDNTTELAVAAGATFNLNGAMVDGNVVPGELDVDTSLINLGVVAINQGSIHALFNSRNQGRYNIGQDCALSLFYGIHTLDGSLGPNTSEIAGPGEVVFNPGVDIKIVGTASVANVDDSADLVDHTANSTLLVTGVYHWRIGKWGGSGQTSITQGAELQLDGAGTGAYALESVLANHATVIWSKAADINVANGGSIVNDLNGVFDIQNNQTISKGAGAGTFTNAGTLQKSQGTGVARINIKYIPIGLGAWTKELGFGTIEFALFVTLNNNVEVDPGGTVAFDGGAELDGGSITDNGTITAVGDFVQNGGFSAIAGAFITSGNYLYNGRHVRAVGRHTDRE